jgi:hypothetical protein
MWLWQGTEDEIVSGQISFLKSLKEQVKYDVLFLLC